MNAYGYQTNGLTVPRKKNNNIQCSAFEMRVENNYVQLMLIEIVCVFFFYFKFVYSELVTGGRKIHRYSELLNEIKQSFRCDFTPNRNKLYPIYFFLNWISPRIRSHAQGATTHSLHGFWSFFLLCFCFKTNNIFPPTTEHHHSIASIVSIVALQHRCTRLW